MQIQSAFPPQHREPLDSLLVNPRIEGFRRFVDHKPTQALHRLRINLSEQIKEGLPQSTHCILTFIRHVFTREVLPVVVGGTNIDDAINIIKGNYRHGLQPLLRVLDSLYEVGERREVKCCVQICFNDATELPGKLLRFSKQNDILDSKKLFLDYFAKLEAPLSWRIPWPSDSDALVDVLPSLDASLPDFATGGELFSIKQPLYHMAISAVESLCSYFQMESTVVAYRSVIAAIYELSQYNAIGGNATTLLFRSQDPMGFATGVTIISQAALSELDFRNIYQCLSAFHEDLTQGVTHIGRVKDAAIKRFVGEIRDKVDPRPFKASTVPGELCVAVRGGIRRHAGLEKNSTYFLEQQKQAEATDTVRHSVDHFLNACLAFCDEVHEGRQLEFGIVLGNPFMFRHWPGARPLPLMKPDNEGVFQNLWLDDLVKQIHLIENPQRRFVVMPYGASFEVGAGAGRGGEAPAFVIDLANFREAIATWSQGLMWSATGSVYAYLTHHYPWAVAAVVGPGSQVRVFSCGRIVGFRNGKGWLLWNDPATDIEHALKSGGNGNGSMYSLEAEKDATRLRMVIEVALQLSSIVRPESRGTLILWAKDRQVFESNSVELQPLNSVEPPRLDPDVQFWLRNNRLLRKNPAEGSGNASNGMQLSYEVAKLTLLAAINDGAVCLSGEECEIVAFGQRVIIKGGGASGDRGTKHATAEAFAKNAGSGAFAIAVSADGPISVYHHGTEGKYHCFRPPR